MVDRQVTSVGVNGVWAGEQWRLRTPEGTEFWFGQTGDSVQDVPVFSDDAGEPCHVAGSLYLSYCQMGYRWNLDKVVDRRGNQIVYRWFDWHANYGRYLNSAAAGYSVYGLPLSAEYGMSAASGWVPQARVVFEAGYRCIDAGQYPASCEGTANQWKWPDTPWDRYCPLVDSSCPGRTSPTFWTVNRLHAITTQVRTGAGGWDGVGRWEMSYSWPATNDGTAPTLWLNAITPSGLVGGVAAGPVTSFGGVRAPRPCLEVVGGLTCVCDVGGVSEIDMVRGLR